MSFFVSFEIENDKRFFEAVQRALTQIDDLRGPFGEIVRDFFKSNQAVFGNKPGLYPDYSDRYKELKTNDPLSLGRPYPMLVRTGRLRDSLTGTPNEDSIVIIGKRSLAIGTDVDYGIYHQSDDARKVIPLRKFLFIGPEARRFVPAEAGRSNRYVAIIEVWVARMLKRAFKK